MEINNLNGIKPLLHWENPDDFYFIEIMQRKKDFPEHTQNVDVKIIKSLYIYSEKELNERFPDIIDACRKYSARAYIWLRKRNCKQICLESARELVRYAQENMSYRGYRIWDHCCGKFPAPKNEKYWIIDFDSKNQENLLLTEMKLNSYESEYPKVVITALPTKNGFHIITHPFDLRQYDGNIEDVKKDSPTLLYCYSE